MPNPKPDIRKATAEDHTVQMLLLMAESNTLAKRLACAAERIADALESRATPGESPVTQARIRAAKRDELLALAKVLKVLEWAERQDIDLSSCPDFRVRNWCLDSLAGRKLEAD